MRYFLLLFSSVLFAHSLQFAGTPEQIVTASDVSIPVYSEVLYGPQTKLLLTGHGIREKKILIASVNVYHAASYLEGASLEKSRVRALCLTFLRDLDSGKIRSSFGDALKENGVSLESPEMQKLFALMSFDVKKGEKVHFIGVRGEKTDTIFFELAGKTLKAEGSQLVENFWKIWFGKPADSGLEALKKLLIKK